jgi:acetyltransferase-like isoleucine patch superfamily enzyme
MSDSTDAPEAVVHTTAIVEQGAEIGEGTIIGPYSIIGADVHLGCRNRIGPHVVIEGHTKIGDDNQIYQFASVGSPPQDLKWRGELATLTIGDRNIIREYATIQPGTRGGGGATVIGDDNLFMASSMWPMTAESAITSIWRMQQLLRAMSTSRITRSSAASVLSINSVALAPKPSCPGVPW